MILVNFIISKTDKFTSISKLISVTRTQNTQVHVHTHTLKIIQIHAISFLLTCPHSQKILVTTCFMLGSFYGNIFVMVYYNKYNNSRPTQHWNISHKSCQNNKLCTL